MTHHLSSMRSVYLVSIFLGLCDYITKSLIIAHHNALPYAITGFFNISYVQNTGVVFGLSHDYGIYLSVSGMIIILLLAMYSDILKRHRWCWALIITGGLCNMFDRMYYGAVIDWIDIHAYNLHWPSFNCADIYIVLGAGYLIIAPYVQHNNTTSTNNTPIP